MRNLVFLIAVGLAFVAMSASVGFVFAQNKEKTNKNERTSKRQSPEDNDTTKKKKTAGKSPADRRNPARTASKKSPVKKTGPNRAASRRPVSPAQEQKVNAFVSAQMPELKSLLDVLKSNEPNRYASAVRELYFAADRLERMQQRDSGAYEMALKSWKLDKQAQLLAARIRMEDSSRDDDELRELLEARFALELRILQRNRNKQAARLKKMDDDIERFKDNRSAAIEKQIQAWTRKGSGRSPKTKAISTRNPAKKTKRQVDKTK